MALRIRFQYPTGASLGYSVERLSDGAYFDFNDSQFRSTPGTIIADLPEDQGVHAGRYKATLPETPPEQFTDGVYVVSIHERNANNLVVAQLPCTMYQGDDSPVFPDPPAPVLDPWAATLPGSYANGSAGYLLGTNLDAKVSSRSTYNGGPVQRVIESVTVGQNLDKTGYWIDAKGLDNVIVEDGINARQAFAPILAAVAGTLTGAGTGSIIIKGAGTVTTRIIASTDNAGNRTSISLNLPN